jgi:hypothetical protein
MNEMRMLAFASFVAIFAVACGGGGGGGSGSDSDNDDTPIDVIPSPTMAKEVLFSELMINPSTLADVLGEWFEIRNPGIEKLSLQNCVFSDAVLSSFIINFDLIIEAGEYLTFAISPNPGFVPDIDYNGTGLTLDNAADTLILTCNGILIDSRNYSLSSNGSSSSLSNNGNAKWCDDLINNYNGDTGTPGFANIDCP